MTSAVLTEYACILVVCAVTIALGFKYENYALVLVFGALGGMFLSWLISDVARRWR